MVSLVNNNIVSVSGREATNRESGSGKEQAKQAQFDVMSA